MAEAAVITNGTFCRAALQNPPLLAGWNAVANVFSGRVWDRMDWVGISRFSVEAMLGILQRYVSVSRLDYPPGVLKLAGFKAGG